MSAPLHVFVLIDAFGWHFADRLDFMSDVLVHRRPLRTVLGYSSGAIPTMLTGKMPAEHGHWNLFYYDPEGSPFRWLRHARVLPDRLLDNRYTRKALKELGRRRLGLGPLFDCAVKPTLLRWFNWIEKRNIYEPDGITGGASIFDELTAAGVPHRVYTYHRHRDAESLLRVRDDIAAGSARFFFVYLSEADAFLHQHCDEDAAVEKRFDWYANELRTVLAAARAKDPGARMTVVSDHGMTPVRRHHDLGRDVASLGLTMPDDYLSVYDSTMARFWFFNDHARDVIGKRLGQLACGRILSESELEALGILFSDRRYGDLVFLMEPGWLITGSDFNGRWLPAGMHGYHPDDPYSDAVLLSTHDFGPAPRTIADVHACLRQASGLVEIRA